MPEMRKLVVSAIHAVRRPANKRPFLLVKSEHTNLGGGAMRLTPEAIAGIQTILETPIAGEDALWLKVAAELGEGAEPALRTGLRLLKSVGGNGSVAAILKEAGLVPDEPPKTKEPEKPKPADTQKAAELPEPFVEVMKEAGFEPYITVLKGLSDNPEVAKVVVPLMTAMAAQLKITQKATEQLVADRHLEAVQKTADALGFAKDDPMVAVMKGMDEEQFASFVEAMQPTAARVKEAEKVLLAEKGTAARDLEGGDALAEVAKQARELVAKGEFSDQHEAERHVLDTNRELYEQHRAESAGKGG